MNSEQIDFSRAAAVLRYWCKPFCFCFGLTILKFLWFSNGSMVNSELICLVLIVLLKFLHLVWEKRYFMRKFVTIFKPNPQQHITELLGAQGDLPSCSESSTPNFIQPISEVPFWSHKPHGWKSFSFKNTLHSDSFSKNHAYCPNWYASIQLVMICFGP